MSTPWNEMTTSTVPWLEAARRADHESLGLGHERPRHVAAVDADFADVELDGVEHELLDVLDDVDGDAYATVERGRPRSGASSTS